MDKNFFREESLVTQKLGGEKISQYLPGKQIKGEYSSMFSPTKEK